jgi:hypothetical protein
MSEDDDIQIVEARTTKPLGYTTYYDPDCKDKIKLVKALENNILLRIALSRSFSLQLVRKGSKKGPIETKESKKQNLFQIQKDSLFPDYAR